MVRSVPPFDEAALTAVRQWEYEITQGGRQARWRCGSRYRSRSRSAAHGRPRAGRPGAAHGRGARPAAGALGPERSDREADVTLDPDGQVTDALVTAGESPWAEALLQALRTWRFVGSPAEGPLTFKAKARFLSAPRGRPAWTWSSAIRAAPPHRLRHGSSGCRSRCDRSGSATPVAKPPDTASPAPPPAIAPPVAVPGAPAAAPPSGTPGAAPPVRPPAAPRRLPRGSTAPPTGAAPPAAPPVTQPAATPPTSTTAPPGDAAGKAPAPTTGAQPQAPPVEVVPSAPPPPPPPEGGGGSASRGVQLGDRSPGPGVRPAARGAAAGAAQRGDGQGDGPLRGRRLGRHAQRGSARERSRCARPRARRSPPGSSAAPGRTDCTGGRVRLRRRERDGDVTPSQAVGMEKGRPRGRPSSTSAANGRAYSASASGLPWPSWPLGAGGAFASPFLPSSPFLAGLVLRPQQLQDRHLRAVAATRAQPQDAGVAAGTRGVAGAQAVEQLAHHHAGP